MLILSPTFLIISVTFSKFSLKIWGVMTCIGSLCSLQWSRILSCSISLNWFWIVLISSDLNLFSFFVPSSSSPPSFSFLNCLLRSEMISNIDVGRNGTTLKILKIGSCSAINFSKNFDFFSSYLAFGMTTGIVSDWTICLQYPSGLWCVTSLSSYKRSSLYLVFLFIYLKIRTDSHIGHRVSSQLPFLHSFFAIFVAPGIRGISK